MNATPSTLSPYSQLLWRDQTGALRPPLALNGAKATEIMDCAMDYRRAVMDQWFEDHRLQELTEDDDGHRARSAAWSAYYGVRLVTGNPQLGKMGRDILDRITELKDVEHREELTPIFHDGW